MEDEKSTEENAEDPWLSLARDAYDQSTSFVDVNYRKQWETNIRHWQSKHASGSKYLRPAYKYRTKLFRPKTRSAIRNHEAAAVAAFFSNRDIVTVEPSDDNDPIQKASAEINQALLQYRLSKTIPWFLLCIGGFQDAMVPGVVCSYQYWEYEEKEITERFHLIDGETNEYILDENGEKAIEENKRTVVKKDHPVVRLIPVENLRIHPSADWTDPVGSSPYLIEMIPMYVMDVKRRMKMRDPKTNQPKWKHLDDGQLKAARKQLYDSTRQVREGQRTDKHDVTGADKLGMFDVVWVHRNIIAWEGEDYVFYTLGTDHMLTDPVPLEEIYFHGERPYAMGTAIIETHKIYTSGIGEMAENVQKELNENVNQRLDNVKFVLNKRWFVKRGSQVDIKSIVRNVPGSATLMNDPEGDVVGQDFNDITGSAYQEQDRLNADFDELVGNFSASTIQTNRRMNETVGGMAMLRGNVNGLVEYSLKTFTETWVEKVIRQLVKLEQKYETDETILALAAKKAKLYQKYGINRITDKLLNQELTTTVNVGMGATDPIMKLRNLAIGLEIILKIITESPPGTLDVMEVAKEVFGHLGYKDGTRFFMKSVGDDPEKMQMGQIIQQLQIVIQDLQKQIETKQIEHQSKAALAAMKEQGSDRRKAAELRTDLALKEMDLLNPVVGEKTQ